MIPTLIAAAVSGMALGASPAPSTPASSHTAGIPAQSAHPLDDKGGTKHACRGQNSCKGQGGCKTDKHACKGQNECKGQGGCKH